MPGANGSALLMSVAVQLARPHFVRDFAQILRTPLSVVQLFACAKHAPPKVERMRRAARVAAAQSALTDRTAVGRSVGRTVERSSGRSRFDRAVDRSNARSVERSSGRGGFDRAVETKNPIFGAEVTSGEM